MSRTLAALSAGVLMSGGMRSDGAEDPQRAQGPQDPPAHTRFDTSLTLNTGMRSGYLPSGFDLGVGPFVEGSARLGLGKHIEFSLWNIRDLGQGQETFNETDLDVTLKFPLKSAGTLTLEGRVGYGHWFLFPGNEATQADILSTGVHASLSPARTELDLSIAEVLPTFGRESGTKLSLSLQQHLVEYTLPGKTTLSLGIGAKLDYLFGFFQEESGLSHITPSLGISLDREHFGTNVGLGYQFGIGDKASTPYYMVGIHYKF